MIVEQTGVSGSGLKCGAVDRSVRSGVGYNGSEVDRSVRSGAGYNGVGRSAWGWSGVSGSGLE